MLKLGEPWPRERGGLAQLITSLVALTKLINGGPG